MCVCVCEIVREGGIYATLTPGATADRLIARWTMLCTRTHRHTHPWVSVPLRRHTHMVKWSLNFVPLQALPR